MKFRHLKDLFTDSNKRIFRIFLEAKNRIWPMQNKKEDALIKETRLSV
jgi:hypothetical protein